MTISLTSVVFTDVFEDNRWPLFDKSRASCHANKIPKLGVIELMATEPDEAPDLKRLAAAVGLEAVSLIRRLPGLEYRTWLFAAHGPWQAKSSISRRLKLWSGFPSLSESAGVLRKSEEVELEVEDRIRFAGVVEVTDEALVRVLDIVRTDHACALFCSARPHIESKESVAYIFQQAFPLHHGSIETSIDWSMLAIALCGKGDILIKISGEFDDREAVADVIAEQERIRDLEYYEGKSKGTA